MKELVLAVVAGFGIASFGSAALAAGSGGCAGNYGASQTTAEAPAPNTPVTTPQTASK